MGLLMVVALVVLVLGIFSAALPFVALRHRNRLPR
jgi:hypothetical protein